MPAIGSDPEAVPLTEEALELLQQARLLEAFSKVDTYDARESIIAACEKLIMPER